MKNKCILIAICLLASVTMQAQQKFETEIITIGSGEKASNPKVDNNFNYDDPDVVISTLIRHFVKVKGGKISTKNSKGKKVIHDVNTFYISVCEITNAEWNAVMGEKTNPSLYCRYYIGTRPAYANDRPVTGITLEQANAFCRKLSEITGIIFRLPSEIEWIYAARGGQKTHGYKYAGSNNGTEVAIYKGNTNHLYDGKVGSSFATKANPIAMPFPVGQMGKNELGIYDMSGNVWEWVANGRIYGGAFTEALKNCTVTSRSSMFITNKKKKTGQAVGFRIVCDDISMG